MLQVGNSLNILRWAFIFRRVKKTSDQSMIKMHDFKHGSKTVEIQITMEYYEVSVSESKRNSSGRNTRKSVLPHICSVSRMNSDPVPPVTPVNCELCTCIIINIVHFLFKVGVVVFALCLCASRSYILSLSNERNNIFLYLKYLIVFSYIDRVTEIYLLLLILQVKNRVIIPILPQRFVL